MTTEENNQAWLRAKEIFESMIHLNKAEMLKELEQIKTEAYSVKKKVKKLIDSMDKNRTLFNQTSSQMVFRNIEKLMDWSGKTINDYQMKALIAVGGMSSIYRAKRLSSEVQKPVAIKVMQPHRDNDSIVALFKQEQQALSKLDHPNIVSFFHGDQTKEGVYYLVMEYISEARTLNKYVQENKCDVKTVVSLIKQVADAMTYAHSHLIIHKDLKSPNILVDLHGAIKIIDFGIAALDEETHVISPKIYTPTIASPEQIKGEKITSGTDVFSLSATLLDLLIDDNPLPEFDPDTYQEIDDKKYVDQMLSASNIDNDLKKIIAKGLQPQLKDRYASMDALANDLGAWLEHKPISLLNHKLSHRIVKHFKRNPVSSWSVSLLAAAVIGASILISYYAVDAKKQAENAQLSLNFLSDVLSQSDPSAGNASDMTIKQALKITLDQQQSILKRNPEMKLNILDHVARIYVAQGLHSEAVQTLSQLYELLIKIEGENSTKTLEMLEKLVDQVQAAGQYEQAIIMSEKLLKQLTPDHPNHGNIKFAAHYIILKANMGKMNHENVDIESQQLIQMVDQGSVDDHKLIGNAYLSIALWTNFKRDKSKLEGYYQKSLFHLEKDDGKTNPTYANTIKEYARYLVRQGKYDQAETLFIKSIELSKKYDPRGYALAENLHRYANLLALTNRDEQAYQNLQQAYSILQSSENNIKLFDIHQSFYKLLKKTHQFSSALDHTMSAIQYGRIGYADHEIPVARNLLRMVEILALMNEYTWAEKVLGLLINKQEKVYKVLSNDLKFKLVIISWLKGHETQEPSQIKTSALLDALNKYKSPEKQDLKVSKLMGSEYQQLKALLEQKLSGPGVFVCNDIDKITSSTDILVLKVMAIICSNHPNKLKAFGLATKTDKDKLTERQLNQVQTVINAAQDNSMIIH